MERSITNPYRRKNASLSRISISLPSDLLSKFDESMVKTGYTDRSKALQAAMHYLVDEYMWKNEEKENGAGAIVMLYNNHIYNQDKKSIYVQHKYADIISASIHLHLANDNCLETIMVKGSIKRITMPLSDNKHLVYITTEIPSDHKKIIDGVRQMTP